MTFLGDEGRDVIVAYNILHGHFTLLGPTASVGGFYFGPIYYYFMAPFLFLFNYNPVGPAVMVALFGIATVWLVYKIGSTFFNRVTGLTAAFLYAISPIVITYSRSSWNPNPVPFFALLIVWFTYKGVVKELRGLPSPLLRSPLPWRGWNFLLAGLFLGIGVELHFIVTILGVVVFLYILAAYLFNFPKEPSLRGTKQSREAFVKPNGIAALSFAMTWIGIGFFVGMLPYLGFELRHGFPNTRSVFNFVFHSGKLSGGNSNFFTIVGNVFFRLFGGIAASYPTPEQFYHYPKQFIGIWFWWILLLATLSAGLLIWQTVSAYKAKKEVKFLQLLLMCLWLFVSILFFGIYKRQIYDYYFGFIFPVPFLLLANFLTFLWLQKNKQLFFYAIALPCFLILVFVDYYNLPFRYEPNRQLLQMETIAKFVNEKTDGEPFNFALITGGNSDHAYRYFFTIWGHEPVTIQNAAVDPKRKTVSNQLLVVCESVPCQPVGNPLWEIAGFGRPEIAGHWGVSVVEVYRLVHYKPPK